MTIPAHDTHVGAPRKALQCGEKPTEPKSALFIATFGFAQLAFFMALLAPVMVSMALKVSTLLDDPAARTAALGPILGIGAIGATLGNVLFGRLSDRTTSRWGRRRPWIIGGTAVMAVALVGLAYATSVWQLMVLWLVAQLGANAAYSPFIATMADQLPEKQYAKVSAMVGIMMNVGILGAALIVARLTSDTLMMFLVPTLIGVVGMVVYALVLPDPVLETKPEKLDLGMLVKSFWVNPRRHPDFGLAWLSRFLLIFCAFLFTTFRLNYLVDHVGLEAKTAAAAVATGVLVYTAALVVSGWAAAVISDRTGRRKALVMLSAAVFGLATVLLIGADSAMQFYVVEAFMGVAFGIYWAVDMALVLQVLPDPDNVGKDLGVFNMANALPQSLAPFAGSMLLGIGGNGPNYSLMLWAAGVIAALGALVIIPIKKVR